MTAELEEVDNKSEKEIEVEKDKKDSPKEEETPKNGGGDVKKIDDEDEKPPLEDKPVETDTEAQQEDEPEPVIVKKRAPRFWERYAKI